MSLIETSELTLVYHTVLIQSRNKITSNSVYHKLFIYDVIDLHPAFAHIAKSALIPFRSGWKISALRISKRQRDTLTLPEKEVVGSGENTVHQQKSLLLDGLSRALLKEVMGKVVRSSSVKDHNKDLFKPI